NTALSNAQALTSESLFNNKTSAGVTSVTRSAEDKLKLVHERINQLEAQFSQQHDSVSQPLINSPREESDSDQLMPPISAPNPEPSNADTDGGAGTDSPATAPPFNDYISHYTTTSSDDTNLGSNSSSTLRNGFRPIRRDQSNQQGQLNDHTVVRNHRSSSDSNTQPSQLQDQPSGQQEQTSESSPLSFIVPEWSKNLDPSFFAEINAKNHKRPVDSDKPVSTDTRSEASNDGNSINNNKLAAQKYASDKSKLQNTDSYPNYNGNSTSHAIKTSTYTYTPAYGRTKNGNSASGKQSNRQQSAHPRFDHAHRHSQTEDARNSIATNTDDTETKTLNSPIEWPSLPTSALNQAASSVHVYTTQSSPSSVEDSANVNYQVSQDSQGNSKATDDEQMSSRQHGFNKSDQNNIVTYSVTDSNENNPPQYQSDDRSRSRHMSQSVAAYSGSGDSINNSADISLPSSSGETIVDSASSSNNSNDNHRVSYSLPDTSTNSNSSSNNNNNDVAQTQPDQSYNVPEQQQSLSSDNNLGLSSRKRAVSRTQTNYQAVDVPSSSDSMYPISSSSMSSVPSAMSSSIRPSETSAVNYALSSQPFTDNNNQASRYNYAQSQQSSWRQSQQQQPLQPQPLYIQQQQQRRLTNNDMESNLLAYYPGSNVIANNDGRDKQLHHRIASSYLKAAASRRNHQQQQPFMVAPVDDIGAASDQAYGDATDDYGNLVSSPAVRAHTRIQQPNTAAATSGGDNNDDDTRQITQHYAASPRSADTATHLMRSIYPNQQQQQQAQSHTQQQIVMPAGSSYYATTNDGYNVLAPDTLYGPKSTAAYDSGASVASPDTSSSSTGGHQPSASQASSYVADTTDTSPAVDPSQQALAQHYASLAQASVPHYYRSALNNAYYTLPVGYQLATTDGANHATWPTLATQTAYAGQQLADSSAINQSPYRRSYIGNVGLRLAAAAAGSPALNTPQPQARYYYVAPSASAPAAAYYAAAPSIAQYQSQYLDPEAAESSLMASADPMDSINTVGTGTSSTDGAPEESPRGQSVSSSSRNMSPWSGIAGLLLGILPFGILMASLLPSTIATGRKKRELELQKHLNRYLYSNTRGPSQVLSALIGGSKSAESSSVFSNLLANNSTTMHTVSRRRSNLDISNNNNSSSNATSSSNPRGRYALYVLNSLLKTANKLRRRHRSWPTSSNSKWHSSLFGRHRYGTDDDSMMSSDSNRFSTIVPARNKTAIKDTVHATTTASNPMTIVSPLTVNSEVSTVDDSEFRSPTTRRSGELIFAPNQKNVTSRNNNNWLVEQYKSAVRDVPNLSRAALSKLDNCLGQVLCRLYTKLNSTVDAICNNCTNNQANSRPERIMRSLIDKITSSHPVATMLNIDKTLKIESLAKASANNQCHEYYKCSEIISVEKYLAEKMISKRRVGVGENNAFQNQPAKQQLNNEIADGFNSTRLV
ncbi:hypothetical protein GZH46_02597, partial [Fragariocoptes setiger]